MQTASYKIKIGLQAASCNFLIYLSDTTCNIENRHTLYYRTPLTQKFSAMELTEQNYQPILSVYYQRIQSVDTKFKRYLYSRINWDARLIGIKGARGVGKTTLLLQRILASGARDRSLYASLDSMWFSTHTLENLVEYFYLRGILEFYLDEVHKYPNWSRTIKNLYDSYPNIKIVYTGSALLAIDHSIADLSRRQSLYDMAPMSFREFLQLEGILDLEPLSLPMIINKHVEISLNLASKIKPLKYFSEYLTFGCYPFYEDNRTEYLDHLAEVIRTVIEVDIAEFEDISLQTIYKLKVLLMIIAENAPLTPNVSKLSERLECSRELCLKMLYLLDKAKLIKLLFQHPSSYRQMKGPEKILPGDTNISHALTADINVGTIRETFFVNQLSVSGEVGLSKQRDFRIDNRYVFEIGGSNKKFSQIADIPDSYLAIDNIETGYGNRIPLYLFGMLY